MALIVPKVGLLAFLNWSFRAHDPALKIHLFQNDYVPDTDSTLANFTESTFNNYAPIVLANWDPAALDGGPHAYTSPDTVTWIRGAPGPNQPVYGYYVTDAASAVLWYAERFAHGPYGMNTAGQELSVTAYFTDKSEF